MPDLEKQRVEIYEVVNGVSILKEVIEKEVEVATEEEIIAKKEEQLLKMYEELEALKTNNK